MVQLLLVKFGLLFILSIMVMLLPRVHNDAVKTMLALAIISLKVGKKLIDRVCVSKSSLTSLTLNAI